ncbi:hypothetical protein YDYSG_36210 [Paenibacillus tyrfis]|nr:hypothetical protein YDYSG_36210 [Paenibacillus tyrfis]
MHQMIDIISVALVGRNPAGRRVRLLQKAHFLQVGHFVTDGGGAESHIAAFGYAAGADRLCRTDVIIDYGA